MSVIYDLEVLLTAETARAEKAVGELTKVVEGFEKRAESAGKAMQDMGKSATKYLTAPIAAAGVAVVAFTSKFASMGDEIAKGAARMGVAVEQYQALDFWATQNGMSTDDMRRMVERLSIRVGQAAEGADRYAAAFERLNVAYLDADGTARDSYDVMRDTIKGLQDLEDSNIQAALAAEIFGDRVAARLLPALRDGSLTIEEAMEQMEGLGMFTEELTKASEDFIDAIDRIKRAFIGLLIPIAEQLIPYFNEILLPLIEDRLIPVIRNALEQTIYPLIQAFTSLPVEVQFTAIAIAGLVATIGPALIALGTFVKIVGMAVGGLATLKPMLIALISPFKLIFAPVKLMAVALTGLKVAVGILAKVFLPLLAVLAAVYIAVRVGMAIWEEYREFLILKFFQAINRIILIFDDLKAMWQNFPAIIEEFTSALQDRFGGLLDWVNERVERFINWIIPRLDYLWGWIKDGLSQVFRWIMDRFEPLVKDIIELIEFMRPIISSFIDWLFGALGKYYDWLFGVFGKLIDVLMPMILILIETFIRTLGDLFDIAQKTFGWIAEKLADMPWYWNRLKEAVDDVLWIIGDRLYQAFEAMRGAGVRAVEAIIRPFLRLRNIVLDVLDAIRSIPSRIGGRLTDTGGSISDWLDGKVDVFHDGGTFRAPTPGGEGLALLKDRETIIPADGRTPSADNVTINITSHKALDEREIRRQMERIARELSLGAIIR